MALNLCGVEPRLAGLQKFMKEYSSYDAFVLASFILLVLLMLSYLTTPFSHDHLYQSCSVGGCVDGWILCVWGGGCVCVRWVQGGCMHWCFGGGVVGGVGGCGCMWCVVGCGLIVLRKTLRSRNAEEL